MSVPLRVVILSDNQAKPGFFGEHGFAMLIEMDQRRILFDCGKNTCVLAANADAAGVDLSGIDGLVLSHGHYDHTGGIPHLLELIPTLPVYCHPDIRQTRYSIREAKPKDISMPPESSYALEKMPAGNLHLVEEPLQLSKNLLLSGPIPRLTEYEDTGGPFYLDTGALQADLLNDELVLLCSLAEGIVVCTGCSHSGIVNILHWTQKRFPGQNILAVIGGFHLGNASAERMHKTFDALRNLPVRQWIPCHCTGEAASAAFFREFPGQVCPGAAGRRWEF